MCNHENQTYKTLSNNVSNMQTHHIHLGIEVGDIVFVSIHTHKKEKGIVCNITKNNTLFIKLTKGSYRIRILSKDILQSIKIIEKAKENEKAKLSARDIQLYITKITRPNDGSNYVIIAGNYESGRNGFPIDFNKAMFWYSAGHQLNNIQCTVALANISSDYHHDYHAAETYWNIGIDKGYPYCAFCANVMFRTVKNGKEKEFYYIKKYVEMTDGTDVSGLLSFAVCQLTMDIPDYYESYKYLIKAYNLDKEAIGVQQFLAIVIYRGLGCDKDENRAVEMHRKLAKDHNSSCSKLWITVHNAIKSDLNDNDNIHPLRYSIYDSFMDVINNGDSHNLYYGNWIKIIEYHALKQNDTLSCCLFIALKIFGILECDINIKIVKKIICNLMDSDVVLQCNWIKSWIWFFSDRYKMIQQISKMHYGLIDVVTEMELSIFVSV